MARNGIVYIFETGVGMKIGKTTRPLTQRMKELSVIHSLRFIHAIRCYDVNGLERHLHERFRHRNIKGMPSRELFNLSFADLMMIRSIDKFRGKPCVHFYSLEDVVRYSIAMSRRFYLQHYGR